MHVEIKDCTVLECVDNSQGKFPSETTTLEVLENGKSNKSTFRFKLEGKRELLTGEKVSITGEVDGWVNAGKNSLKLSGETIRTLKPKGGID